MARHVVSYSLNGKSFKKEFINPDSFVAKHEAEAFMEQMKAMGAKSIQHWSTC